MDFLVQQEISGIKQDMQHGLARQEVGKMEYEKKLLDGLGQEMYDTLEHPEKEKDKKKFAKKYNRKKKIFVLKENIRKIFGTNPK